jgi:hypothetical protein
MAQPGSENPSADRVSTDESGAKLGGQRARQGQNIKGMLAVLVVGILLVAVAFAVMLGLQAEPRSVTDESRTEAAGSETTQSPPPPSPVQQPQQETTGSPN